MVLPPRPSGRPWSLGPRVASAAVEAVFTGPVPPRGPVTPRAAAWRDGGGTLRLPRLALGWGPLGLSGSATLSLDDRLQPVGAATLRMVGQDATLEAMVAAGSVSSRTALAARGVLAILAHAPEGGGEPQVDLPVTLQDGTLDAAHFPLARLPEWVWP